MFFLNSNSIKILKTVIIEIEIPPCSNNRPIYYRIGFGKDYPNAKYFTVHHTYNTDWVMVVPARFAEGKSQAIVQMYNYLGENLKGVVEICVIGQD